MRLTSTRFGRSGGRLGRSRGSRVARVSRVSDTALRGCRPRMTLLVALRRGATSGHGVAGNATVLLYTPVSGGRATFTLGRTRVGRPVVRETTVLNRSKREVTF